MTFTSTEPFEARRYCGLPYVYGCSECMVLGSRCESHEQFRAWEDVEFNIQWIGSTGKLLVIDSVAALQ